MWSGTSSTDAGVHTTACTSVAAAALWCRSTTGCGQKVSIPRKFFGAVFSPIAWNFKKNCHLKIFFWQFSQQWLGFSKRNFIDIYPHPIGLCTWESYQYIISFQRCEVIIITVTPPSDSGVHLCQSYPELDCHLQHLLEFGLRRCLW